MNVEQQLSAQCKALYKFRVVVLLCFIQNLLAFNITVYFSVADLLCEDQKQTDLHKVLLIKPLELTHQCESYILLEISVKY